MPYLQVGTRCSNRYPSSSSLLGGERDLQGGDLECLPGQGFLQNALSGRNNGEAVDSSHILPDGANSVNRHPLQ